MADSVRIDKWLWAVRIFKTRSIAVEELKKHRILINGQPVKPSRMVSVGDELDVRKPPIIRTYKVLGLLEKRVGAKLVAEYVLDITPQEELDKLDLLSLNVAGIRERGTGRPTKKERRDLDDFKES
ncbi:MAG: RNA-binding S4 domain-containing protein [Salinivirgaceae bacterium]|nr:RNA-binding S4 domain-containing protein [Salinivirgaceae bacterium]MDD4747161.1 RNA-binding S4 domain-containing protein [Salinivirgaceae bacterium]MDY0281317.1 RNA-binding S4 domain-containing protein [Salinivirgaceae bacterium]